MTTLAQSMSQLDLLNLARSCGQSIASDFAQAITITFAMVVAIYYFLHQAGIRMRVFAFIIYTCGMLTYYGMMVLESGLALGVLNALHALPRASLEAPTREYLGVRDSWVGITTSVLFSLVYCILWMSTSYLLFFWKRPREIAPLHD